MYYLSLKYVQQSKYKDLLKGSVINIHDRKDTCCFNLTQIQADTNTKI